MHDLRGKIIWRLMSVYYPIPLPPIVLWHLSLLHMLVPICSAVMRSLPTHIQSHASDLCCTNLKQWKICRFKSSGRWIGFPTKIALKMNACWATGPTKARSLLLIWKKGKDSKKPSTRPMYAVRPVCTPPLELAGWSPPRSRAPRRSPRPAPRLHLARG